MERRGSGICRVMNSYADFDIKPIFYSNEYFFLVSLPNRGNELRNGMKSNKTQLTPDKTQLTDLKIIIQTRAAKSFRKDTLKKLSIYWKFMNSPTLLTGRLWQLNLESVKMRHHGF